MKINFSPKNIWPYALLLPGIIILRNILEGFSDTDLYRTPKTLEIAPEIFLHFLPWYLLVFLVIIIALHLITKHPIGAVFKFITLGSLIILLPPVIDLAVSGGRGLDIAYCQPNSWAELGSALLTMCGPNHQTGVTIGIMTELLVIMTGCFTYVILVAKNIIKAILASILVYLIIMIAGVAPILLVKLSNGLSLANFPLTSISVGGFFYLLLVLAVVIFLRLYQPDTFKQVFKNARLNRGLIYIVFLGLGIAISLAYYGALIDWSLDIIFTMILAVCSILGAWGQAALVNDVMDRKIDQVSNPHRGLITGQLIPADYWWGAAILIIISLGAAGYVSHTFFMLLLAFIILTFLYSCPPLRLRQLAGISNFVIALAALICLLAGFAVFSPEQSFQSFPPALVFMTLVLVTIVSIVKDLKDIAGDTANRVNTIPSLLSRRFSPAITHRLVGILVAISFLTVPFILYQYFSWILFIFTALFAFFIYWLIGEIKAQDKYYLLTIYCFIAVTALIILGRGLILPQ